MVGCALPNIGDVLGSETEKGERWRDSERGRCVTTEVYISSGWEALQHCTELKLGHVWKMVGYAWIVQHFRKYPVHFLSKSEIKRLISTPDCLLNMELSYCLYLSQGKCIAAENKDLTLPYMYINRIVILPMYMLILYWWGCSSLIPHVMYSI